MIGKILLPIVKEFSQSGKEFNAREAMTAISLDKMVYWSWGASNPINYCDKVLVLSVNGRYHKGKILIRLNGWDLYDVMFVTSQNKIKGERKDIFFDDLITVIDNCIESNPKGFEMYT
jgi:ABC-type uncharacterized transport system permease subunit